MKVFVSGASGFVGREVLAQLVSAGHQVVALVRPGSEQKLAPGAGVTMHPGDVLKPRTLAAGLKGCQAAIHLVGIIREFPGKGITFARLHTEATQNLVDAARSQGVRRFLHMSSNGTRPGASSAYHQTKWAAEEIVRGSDLDWTIFQPSLIYGKNGEFITMLAELIRKLPVVPVIGDGRYRMSPVAVEDVARSFCRALEMPETIGRCYACCGAASYSYNEILDLVGRPLGKQPVTKLHHPVFMIKPVVKMMENLPQFPLTSTQLTMLLEGNVCDPQPWSKTFDIAPRDFADDIAGLLNPVSAQRKDASP